MYQVALYTDTKKRFACVTWPLRSYLWTLYQPPNGSKLIRQLTELQLWLILGQWTQLSFQISEWKITQASCIRTPESALHLISQLIWKSTGSWRYKMTEEETDINVLAGMSPSGYHCTDMMSQPRTSLSRTWCPSMISFPRYGNHVLTCDILGRDTRDGMSWAQGCPREEGDDDIQWDELFSLRVMKRPY